MASLSIDDVSMIEGDTPTTKNYEFTITSNAIASENIEVAINTANLDAVGDMDFTAITAGNAVIAAGDNTATVMVTVIGDAVVEADEMFEVQLSNGKFAGAVDIQRVVIADPIGTGKIENDDSTTISINDIAVVEGDTGTTNLVFTISSAVAAGRDIQVEVDTVPLLEAAAGVDYIEIIDQDVTITAGSTTASLVVTVLADTIVEINETIRADLTNVRFDGAVDTGRVTLGDAMGVGTIVNDDGLTVSINDVTKAEGDSGSTNFVFTVSSTAAASKNIEVTFETAGMLEAIAGVDYTAIAPTKAVILAGSQTAMVTVLVNGDDLVEIDEQFAVNLSAAELDGAPVIIADNQGIGTIENDDVASLTITNVSQVEADSGTTTYTFDISSNLSASKDINFTINTADAGATAGSDYVAISGQAGVISTGSTSTSVDVTVNGDLVVEANETFEVNLSDAVFNSVANPSQIAFADGQGIGTIENNDTAVLSIDDVSASENGTFTFTITSSHPTEIDITGTVDTVNIAGQALAGTDYTAIGGATFTIIGDSADTTDTVMVTVIDENVVEDNEDFNVSLSNPLFGGAADTTRATFTGGKATGLGTIENNDTAVLSINDVSTAENGTFTFTITSSNPTDTDITGKVDTENIVGEALAGADYTAITGVTFTISGNSMDQTDTVTVTVSDDDIVEDNEDFNVNLSDAMFGGATDLTRATLSGGKVSGLGTIENNDTATLSINDVGLAENGTFTFTITSSNPTETDITGTVDTENIAGEALAGTDYTAIVGATFTISGDSVDKTASVTVTVNDDNIVEDDEEFSVKLSNALFGGAVDSPRHVDRGNRDRVGDDREQRHRRPVDR